ncbi:glycosyltransferase family 4 protein [uncultured Algibacter sp.]|uniref:glycosyltransferase family 4 protein n=1 Tax=uncultured Algibacter sp. TaxID=298659 RepID=UPI00260F968C|nr:glycosyltransferase family 4 protein [uncultured Algibacter sp.]
MKRNLLYIGNKLKHKNSSSIDLLGKQFENEGYSLFYASSKTFKLWRLIDMLWACLYYRNSIHYVLLDTYSTQNFYYAFFVSQLCRLLKLKYIPILHGGNLPDRLRNNSRLSKLIFNYAYKNIAPSKYLKHSFENFGYDNIVHIPNTIEIKNYPYKEKKIETIRLLWVRSFSKIYNPKLAVRVLKTLIDEGYDALLCMVGPDSDGSLKEVKDLASNINAPVKFTGKLSKEEWVSLSKDYNIFINTTNFDNMPVSVIEAMALGLPVVSTNVGGMPFLINNGVDGLLVEPNSEEAFVNAIKTIFKSSTKTAEIAYKARKKVEQFDWNVVKKQWFLLLNN